MLFFQNPVSGYNINKLVCSSLYQSTDRSGSNKYLVPNTHTYVTFFKIKIWLIILVWTGTEIRKHRTEIRYNFFLLQLLTPGGVKRTQKKSIARLKK